MKNSSYIIYLFLIFLSSCTEVKKEEKRSSKNGGTLVIDTYANLYTDRTLNPKNMSESIFVYIYQSSFETLTRINPNSSKLEPFLAHDWKSSDDGQQFVFNLRTDVFFPFDDKPMDAYDVKWCFNQLCEAEGANVGYAKIEDIIVGLKEYKKQVEKGKETKGGVSGITVLNDSTIQFDLTKPFMPFPSLLTDMNFAVYRLKKDGFAVGTGPFYRDSSYNNNLYTKRHEKYWRFDEDGCRLPYLDGVSYISNGAGKVKLKQRLSRFVDDSLHIIKSIKTDDIGTVMQVLREENDLDFNYESIDYSRLIALALNTKQPPFDNVNVRLAFDYAFNAELFVDSVINGEGWPADHGFVPPELTGYSDTVRTRKFNLAKARAFLTKAGYPNGKGFPDFKLLVIKRKGQGSDTTNAIRTKISYAAMKMICNNLNIDFTEEYSIGYADLMQKTWKGRFGVSPFIYTAKFTSPISYLSVFHLKIDSSEDVVHDNIMFYRDSTFDYYYEMALAEKDIGKRKSAFLEAEQRMFSQAPIIPLFYTEYNRIVSDKLEGLSPMNNLALEDYTYTYFKKNDRKKER